MMMMMMMMISVTVGLSRRLFSAAWITASIC